MKNIKIIFIQIILVCFIFSTQACSSASTNSNEPEDNESLAQGYVVYRANALLYRLATEADSTPENISDMIEAVLGAGEDGWAAISDNGAHYLISTERDECEGWACLYVANEDLSVISAIELSDHSVLHDEGMGDISSDGLIIVYPANDGDQTHIYMTENEAGEWSDPVSLTEASPYDYHTHPQLNSDNSKIVFDCGDTPYTDEGTGVCEVNVDGTGFSAAILPEDGPGGTANSALHHPVYTSADDIVFEADWEGEQIWLFDGNDFTNLSGDDYTNDNTPCVTTNDSVVSLWLNRAGGEGYHELKLMSISGTDSEMLLIDVDVADVGISCSR